MPSQRERSLTAGFIGGFFGQKNRNTEARRVQQDRLEELKKNMELERSKTQYTAAQEEQNRGNTFYKTVQASGGVKKDGTMNASGLSLAAQQAFGSAWQGKSKKQQHAWLTQAEAQNKTPAEWRKALFGNQAKYDKVASAMGESPHANVNKVTSNVVSNVASKEQMTNGSKAPTVTPTEPAGINDEGLAPGLLGGLDKEVLEKIEITENGVNKLKVIYTDGTSEVLDVGGDVEPEETKMISQSYIDLDTNKPVSAFWRLNDKGEPEVWGERPDGTRTSNIRPETDAGAASRVDNAPLREQANEMVLYRNSFEGIKTLKKMAMTYNTADIGIQGAINNISAYLGANINPWLSVEQGQEDMRKVAESLGIEGVTSEADAKVKVKEHTQRKVQAEMFMFFDDNFDDEQASELKQLARTATNNVYKTSLIYLTAKALRGQGKLNTSDIDMVKGMIKDNMGEEQFLGSLAAINDVLVTKARSGARRILDDADQRLSDVSNKGKFFRSKDAEEGRMGVLYRAYPKDKWGKTDETTGELYPAYVYVDGETGNIRKLTTPEELQGFKNNMQEAAMFSINYRE